MALKNLEEQKLVISLLTKEKIPWEEFYNSYSGGLMYLCMRYIKNKEDVRDVLQNSFVKMFNSIDSFQYRGSGALKAWASRIVINEALRQLRSSSFSEVSCDSELIQDLEDTAEPDITELSESVILEMIRSLPDGYRTVFNLFVFEQKSHKEIAKLLNIAENSSASQFHRAKKMLAKQIKDYKQFKSNLL